MRRGLGVFVCGRHHLSSEIAYFDVEQPMANFSYQQFKRLAYIDSILRTGKFCTARELARPFSRSTRTIERDIARLRDDFGAPVYFDHNKGGYGYHDLT